MIKTPYSLHCQHPKLDLQDKSLKFSDKERTRDGNSIIAEVDLIEVDGKTIAKCKHGDKAQRWIINEDFSQERYYD
jgi:hypothetical protein